MARDAIPSGDVQSVKKTYILVLLLKPLMVVKLNPKKHTLKKLILYKVFLNTNICFWKRAKNNDNIFR